MRLKQAISEHFAEDYTSFYRHFHPDLQPRNGRATVLCSLHDDHDPSVDVELMGERAGSYYCHVCKQGGDALAYFAAKKGLDIKKEFPQVLKDIAADFGIKPSSNGHAKQIIVATFDYTDESGTLLYQTVRREPGKNGRAKDFQIRRPDGNGDWIWNAKGVQKVPYRLDKLLETKDQGPVVIVEGEAKADALWAMGIRVTTNAGGAGKWEDSYSKCLDGEDLILWPDNDKAGCQHCDKVGRSAKAHANSIRCVSPPSELGEKGDVLDGIKRLGWQKGDVERLLSAAQVWQPKEASDEEKVRESQASRLVKMVCAEAELFHDQHHTPYALVNAGDHYEVLRCTSIAFKRWMMKLSYDAEDQVPGREAVNGALNMLEAFAAIDGDRYELQNRVATHKGAFWLDLTDEKCRAISITASGWEIVDDPPILFSRYEHHAPHPEPIHGGDINRLFDFVPISEPDGDDAPSTRLLLLTWLVSCLVPGIPHPIPVIHGPQGSGKSSICRLLRRLIDPSSLETLSLPRDQNELTQKLAHHYVAIFDNIDVLPPWQSDALCRACTGEGVAKRKLYTDDEDIIYKFRRCVGLNGINIAATRADLLDRSILIELERIPTKKRLEEEELEAAFREARPHILGGILDTLVKAIKIKPTVELASKPRMADFARYGCAIAKALGHSASDFQRAYAANIKEQNAEVLVGHPVAAAVCALMSGREDWKGEPGALLMKLEEVAEDAKINLKDRLWPKGSNWLTRRLKEVKPNLAAADIAVNFSHSGRKVIHIQRVPENTVHTVQTDYQECKALGNRELELDGILDGKDGKENTVHDTVQRNSLQNNGFEDVDGMDGIPPKSSGVEDLRRVVI